MAKLPVKTKKLLIGFAGWFVLLAGIIMIPYPGPGWAVVFIGLSILAREFTWAHRTHQFARGKYDSWRQWLDRQPLAVKAVFWLLTTLTVIVTIWLLNGYGLLNDWLHLDQNWVKSPWAH